MPLPLLIGAAGSNPVHRYIFGHADQTRPISSAIHTRPKAARKMRSGSGRHAGLDSYSFLLAAAF
jgi:hypothetical protein